MIWLKQENTRHLPLWTGVTLCLTGLVVVGARLTVQWVGGSVGTVVAHGARSTRRVHYRVIGVTGAPQAVEAGIAVAGWSGQAHVLTVLTVQAECALGLVVGGGNTGFITIRSNFYRVIQNAPTNMMSFMYSIKVSMIGGASSHF